MPYAFVNQGETSVTGLSTTVAVTYTPTAGNLLVFAVTWGLATGTATIADGGVGNTVTALAAALADATAGQSTRFFYAENCKGGSTTFTATISNSDFRCIYVGEYSGLALSGSLLNTAQQQQRLPATTTDLVSSTNANATSQPALVWGFSNDYNATVATAAGTGFTGRTLVWNYGGATKASRPEDKRVTVTGNVAATFTAGGASEEFHTVVGLFAEATSAGGSIPPQSQITLNPGGVPMGFTPAAQGKAPNLGPVRWQNWESYPWMAAGAPLTIALTGSTITFSTGTPLPSTDVPLVGAAETYSTGSLTPSNAVALLGVLEAFATGTLGVALDVRLSGTDVLFNTGTMQPSGDVTVALTGTAITFSLGTLGVSLSVPLVGAPESYSTGTLTPAATIALTGATETYALGTLAPSSTVPLVGTNVVFNTGTLTATSGGDITVALTGVDVIFQSGTLTPSGGDAGSGSGGDWLIRMRRRGVR